MSESVKPRIAVDLDEIERQLAHAQAAPTYSTHSTRNDPLAELARIVGQDDPFQSLLSQEQGRARTQVPDLDDMFRGHEQPVPRAAMAPELRAGIDQTKAYDPARYQHAAPVHAYQDVQADPAQSQADYDDHAAYDQGYYADSDVDSSGYAEERDVRTLEPRRSRRGLMAISAVAAALVLGAGGAWYAKSGPSAANGQPPLIKASNEPTKVQPDNPGGVEIPNQNKQIYERAKQTTETKVVNREEQPIDVKEATRIASAGAPDSTGTTSPSVPAAQNAGRALNLGEPRKVRTVSIRPDGTVAGVDSANARPAAIPAPPAMTMPAATQPTAAPNVQAAAQPVKAATSTPSTATPVQKPVAGPAPAGGTLPQTAPQKVASAQPMALAAAAEPAASTGAGGFAVQLGVRTTEAEAQKAYNQFQQKYADLGGQPALIRKAEVNGSTVYRVRVGPMSRDDASSLCSKLQGDGAQCYVAKN
jgi:cell division septation protein DedD